MVVIVCDLNVPYELKVANKCMQFNMDTVKFAGPVWF